MDTISHFHVTMTTAHTTLTQACLGVLLHFDVDVTRASLEEFPLAKYAVKYWASHARIENVSSSVQDGIERLFDPSKSHLSVWTWIDDPVNVGRNFLSSESPDEATKSPGEATETPLHYPTFYGMHDIVIVEHSQDVNARARGLLNRNQTPLHVATLREHADIAQLLLEHGADANAQDNFERTPLFLASENGFVEIARVLLEHGADTEVRALPLIDDIPLMSPLEQASSRGHVEVVQALLEHGAYVNAENKITRFHSVQNLGTRLFLEPYDDPNALGFGARTALHYASSNGHVGVVRVLLEHGVDANAQNVTDATPLHQASEYGRAESTRILLEHGVDANARDINNATPLHLACTRLHLTYIYSPSDPPDLPGVIRLLLHYGADIHARDEEGRTPFMRATEQKQSNMMQFLLEHGAEDHRVAITTDTGSGN